MEKNRRIVSLLVENDSGALSRIVGLFAQRGFNIESMNVAPTENNKLSRMTIATEGDSNVLQQIIKQLNRIIDVYKVADISSAPYVERELMLIKIQTDKDERQEVKNLVDVFRAKIVDVTADSYIVEVTGDSSKLDAFITALNPSRIIETVRTGRSGMYRRSRALK